MFWWVKGYDESFSENLLHHMPEHNPLSDTLISVCGMRFRD